jgi:DNA polymerase I-like protein with 3'-5' exonuclease and polymerase domains
MSKIINSGGLQELPNTNYQYITSTEEALRHIEFIERHPIIEVDTEATGLDPFTDRVVLLQIGVHGKAYVFDVRDERVDTAIFKPLLEGQHNLKLLQNVVFDYKMLKTNFDIELNRVYDTMLAEQLLHLGLHPKSNLQHLVAKYLHLNMPKDVATSFKDYNQEYKEYQLRYAANDVVVLKDIYNLQLHELQRDGLMRAAQLEFEFSKPLAEMELNGMLLDVPQWREILGEKIVEHDKLEIQLLDAFSGAIDQTTLFGVSLLNLDSPTQVVKYLNDLGVPVKNTDVKELNKYKKNPIVSLLLDYRKHAKFITTYGEPMIDRINPVTGRLHTKFKQMVDTGRLSSSDPNLQNIPNKQKYRACFIARPGYKLITCDMSQAELRILGDFSGDPVFLESFDKGLDLHTRTAADLFGLTYDEVVADKKLLDNAPGKKNYRGNVKALNFGLIYGLTRVGLALRMETSEGEAQKLIDAYFKQYPHIKTWLDKASKFAVMNRYSTTISGRRRYYRLPEPSDPKFNKLKGAIERQGKNHKIQGSNADTIKQAMVYINDRVQSYDARLLSTVHDETIVEVKDDQVEEVTNIVSKATIDGFAEFFSKVKMTADADVANYWVKG